MAEQQQQEQQEQQRRRRKFIVSGGFAEPQRVFFQEKKKSSESVEGFLRVFFFSFSLLSPNSFTTLPFQLSPFLSLSFPSN